MSKATITEVAALAGVSIKTVSRVINHEPTVRLETVEKVLSAIGQLGYQPNNSARSMRGQRAYAIGLMHANVAEFYALDVQQGVLQVCNSHHYGLVICPADQEADRAIGTLREILGRSQIDAIILTPPHSDNVEIKDLLEQRQLPYACIAPPPEHRKGIAVRCNDHAAAYQLTEYLIDLGHRDIAFVAGNPRHSAVQERARGVTESMRAHNLKQPARLRFQGYNYFSDGVDAARKFLRQKRPPSAIMCANDNMAAGVIHAAHAMGIDVPVQLSVTGFDDAAIATQLLPELTTVRQPVKEMAATAAELLLAQLRETKGIPRQVEFECELVLRQSTAAPAPL